MWYTGVGVACMGGCTGVGVACGGEVSVVHRRGRVGSAQRRSEQRHRHAHMSALYTIFPLLKYTIFDSVW